MKTIIFLCLLTVEAIVRTHVDDRHTISLNSVLDALPPFNWTHSAYPSLGAAPRRSLLQSTDDLHCQPYNVITGAADGFTTFGVGRPASYATYDNGITCSWLVEPMGMPPITSGVIPVLSLVFTFFEVEYNSDTVKIYNVDTNDQPTTLVVSETGEKVSPFVVRVPGARKLFVVFNSDSSTHLDNPTLQVGFTATFIDSSSGQCFNDCNGHGTCTDGMCTCHMDPGLTYLGADCSLPCPRVSLSPSGTNFPIRDLCVGCWAYFVLELTGPASYNLIELRDFGLADSDPFLLLGYEPPTLTPGTAIANDWFDWYYDRSDLHYLAFSATTSARVYIGATT
jgi:hypothetical protein